MSQPKTVAKAAHPDHLTHLLSRQARHDCHAPDEPEKRSNDPRRRNCCVSEGKSVLPSPCLSRPSCLSQVPTMIEQGVRTVRTYTCSGLSLFLPAENEEEAFSETRAE